MRVLSRVRTESHDELNHRGTLYEAVKCEPTIRHMCVGLRPELEEHFVLLSTEGHPTLLLVNQIACNAQIQYTRGIYTILLDLRTI
jgi:hypothetical protein